MAIFLAVFLIILIKVFIGLSILRIIRAKSNITIDKMLIIGWGITVLLLYSVARFSISKIYATSVIWVLIIASIFLFQYSSLNHRKLKFDFNYFLVVVPGLLILFAPQLLNNQIFYQNWGPDLDGNLISMAYLKQGKGFFDLLTDFKGAYENFWWNSSRIDPWKVADVAHGISIEFFIRSVRWSHAVEGNILNKLFNKDVWFGLFALMIASIVASQCLIYHYCKKIGVTRLYALILTLILGLSQSVILMSYEGINVQLIYLPLFLYIIFNIDDLFKNNIQNKIIILIATLTLIISFGEGVQIIISVLLVYFLLNFKNYNKKNTFQFLFSAAILVSILFPTIIFDFIAWTYVRLLDGMHGGALHYKFSVLNVLFPLPYFHEPLLQGRDAIRLFFEPSSLINYITVFILIVLTYLARSFVYKYLFIISIYIILFIVIYTGHEYALWKYCVLFQSLIILYSFRRLFLKENSKVTYILLILLFLNIYFALITVLGYSKITRVVSAKQFAINRSQAVGCYGVVTPSSSPIYYRLGTVGDLKLLHGRDRQFGLLPHFSKDQESCGVAVYFDCDAEGQDFCSLQKNKNSMNPNHIYITKYKIRDLINSDGYVDNNFFRKIQGEYFTGPK